MNDPLYEVITAKEVQVWEALLRGDAAADAAALAPEFIGVYPDGIADRAAHVGQVERGPSVSTYDLTDIVVRPVGDNHALIIYHARFSRPGRTEEAMWVSSLWQRAGTDWRNVFSQDTPAA